MRSQALLSFAAVLLMCLPAFCQDSAEPLHAPDGNVREMMMSIIIPPVKNAPFRGIVTAEWKRTLEDGTTVTLKNRRVVMRDSAGRIFQERRRLVPDGQEPELMQLEISDPSSHIKYYCRAATHQCVKHGYFMPANLPNMPEKYRDNNERFLSRENLGTDTISGINVVGIRETTTMNPGTIGNDSTISITKEFWYSSRLGVNLSVKRTDPLHGVQSLAVTDIDLSEPAALNFGIPAGYSLAEPKSSQQAASSDGESAQ
jgi:hypothetical protein